MSWVFNGKEVTREEMPEWAEGFVYKIIHIPSSRYYIGKKTLFTNRNVKIGKRELTRLKEERKNKGIGGRTPAKKFVRKESDWETYYSSNDWIKEQIKEGKEKDFHREILQFCPTKKSMTYYEVFWQMKEEVLLDEFALNENISGKFYKKDLETKQQK